jgi:predicted nucleotidyltransferase
MRRITASAAPSEVLYNMSDLSNSWEKRHNDTLPEEVLAALKQNLGDALVSVILFGSRARGEAHENSDWDLLIVARDLPSRYFKRHIQLKEFLPATWRGDVTVLAKTPQEFEAYLPSLFLDIALDGIILYDTDDYAHEKMTTLKHFIQEQGLHRERIGHDWLWRWERFPGFDWSLDWEKVQHGSQ